MDSEKKYAVVREWILCFTPKQSQLRIRSRVIGSAAVSLQTEQKVANLLIDEIAL